MKVRKGFVSNSSTSSFVLIGLLINQAKYEEKFFTRVRKRNCKCILPDGLDITTLPKCPMCGYTAMIERLKRNKSEERGKIGKFDIHENANEETYVSIPGTYQYGSEFEVSHSIIPDNIAELKQELKEALEPLGLWDEKHFGVWAGAEYNG